MCLCAQVWRQKGGNEFALRIYSPTPMRFSGSEFDLTCGFLTRYKWFSGLSAVSRCEASILKETEQKVTATHFS